MNQSGEPNSTSDCFYELGIDVGAISTKVLLLKDGKEVLGSLVRPTSMEPGKLAEEMMRELLTPHNLHQDQLQSIVATGQGRRAVSFATMARTEITAFARAAYHQHPEAALAVDFGGQGVRVMKLGELGIVSDFKTNDKCSSGTGCFLDTAAIALELGIQDIGELSQRSESPANVTTSCTVFMESELVSLVARGEKKEDILAGINAMVARKLRGLVNSTRSEGTVFIGGGVAQNQGLMAVVKETLDQDVVLAEEPQFTAALGAALLAPKPWDEDDVELDWEEEDEGTKREGWSSLLKRLFGRGKEK